MNKNKEADFRGKKLRFYRLCENKFCYEEYIQIIDVIRNPQHRAALAKLRTSDHKLHIELGRHNGTPVEDRLCHHCDMGQIDDEYHFLFECNKQVEPRQEQLNITMSE